MRICGIDPGLVTTGYAMIDIAAEGGTVVDAGTIRPAPGAALSVRLLQLHDDLCTVFAEHAPEVVAVERVYSHYNHPQTAVLMGHARGVILLAAGRRGVAVQEYSATQIKRSLTGNGRASKAQVQQAIRLNLRLVEDPQPHDVADALAVALCEAVYGARRPQPGGDEQVLRMP